MKATYKKGKLLIPFRYANALKISDGEAFHWMQLLKQRQSSNKKIIIICPAKLPFVYYAWKSFTDSNLMNAEGIPAPTFK